MLFKGIECTSVSYENFAKILMLMLEEDNIIINMRNIMVANKILIKSS